MTEPPVGSGLVMHQMSGAKGTPVDAGDLEERIRAIHGYGSKMRDLLGNGTSAGGNSGRVRKEIGGIERAVCRKAVEKTGRIVRQVRVQDHHHGHDDDHDKLVQGLEGGKDDCSARVELRVGPGATTPVRPCAEHTSTGGSSNSGGAARDGMWWATGTGKLASEVEEPAERSLVSRGLYDIGERLRQMEEEWRPAGSLQSRLVAYAARLLCEGLLHDVIELAVDEAHSRAEANSVREAQRAIRDVVRVPRDPPFLN